MTLYRCLQQALANFNSAGPLEPEYQAFIQNSPKPLLPLGPASNCLSGETKYRGSQRRYSSLTQLALPCNFLGHDASTEHKFVTLLLIALEQSYEVLIA